VYAFTDLVKFNKKLPKEKVNVGECLRKHLEKAGYSDQIEINLDIEMEINVSLFCTAIDNLIRNGLKYNDSKRKFVLLYLDKNNAICIKDNGRGLSKKDFFEYCKPYSRKVGQKEPGSGLGLNIAQTIIKEHGFKLDCEKIIKGTIMRIEKDEYDQ
jgi:signal transduction histidine kinase